MPAVATCPEPTHPAAGARGRRPAATLLAALVGAALAPTAWAVDHSWTAGTFVPGTTAPEPLPAGDVLLISGGGSKTFGAGSSFTNDGTVSWLASSGGLSFAAGASVLNRGLWDAQGNQALTASGADVVFTNSGTLRKSAGTGTSSVGNNASFRLVNSGTVDAQTGTLVLGGLNEFLSGTAFTGAGVVSLSRASSFSGSIQSQNLLIAGTASVAMTGNGAVLNGSVGWTGGRLEGGWTVASGASLNGLGSSATGNKVIGGAGTAVAVDGTLRLDSFTSISLTEGAAFTNRGRVELADSGGFGHGGGAATLFSNDGLLVKQAGSATTVAVGTDGNFGFVNSGTIESQSGTLQLFGLNTFQAGSVITGAGRVAVNRASTFIGAIRADNLDIAATRSVAMTGVDTVVSGHVGWTGGNLVGQWTVAADGQLDALGGSATGNKVATAALITNHGTMTLNSATGIGLIDGSRIVNHGRHDIQSNADIRHSGDGAAAHYENHGLLVKTGGTGASLIGSGDGTDFTLLNLGTIEVQTGTLRLSDGFGNDGVLSGTGTLQVSGLMQNRGTFAPGSLGTAGTLDFTGSFTQAASSVFAVDIGSGLLHDLLDVSGSAQLGGTLALNCLAACSLEVGQQIIILQAGAGVSGSFAAVTLQGFATGAFEVLYNQPMNTVALRVTEAVTAVPEPAPTALLVAGLAVLGMLARRRQRPG